MSKLGRRTVRLDIRLSEDEMSKLEYWSWLDGKSKSDFVRDAMAIYGDMVERMNEDGSR